MCWVAGSVLTWCARTVVAVCAGSCASVTPVATQGWGDRSPAGFSVDQLEWVVWDQLAWVVGVACRRGGCQAVVVQPQDHIVLFPVMGEGVPWRGREVLALEAAGVRQCSPPWGRKAAEEGGLAVEVARSRHFRELAILMDATDHRCLRTRFALLLLVAWREAWVLVRISLEVAEALLAACLLCRRLQARLICRPPTT